MSSEEEEENSGSIKQTIIDVNSLSPVKQRPTLIFNHTLVVPALEEDPFLKVPKKNNKHRQYSPSVCSLNQAKSASNSPFKKLLNSFVKPENSSPKNLIADFEEEEATDRVRKLEN